MGLMPYAYAIQYHLGMLIYHAGPIISDSSACNDRYLIPLYVHGMPQTIISLVF